MKTCKQLWGRGWEAGPFRRSPSSQGRVKEAAVDPSWHRSASCLSFLEA